MKNLLEKCSRETAKKGNVMTPLNWMCGLTVTPSFYALSYNYNNWVGGFAAIFLMGITIFYCINYFHFCRKDPDRLQSEQYNLDKKEMSLIYEPQPGKTPYIEAQSDAQPVQLVESTIQPDNNS